MKAIIIQESDACNLLDQLKLANFNDIAGYSHREEWCNLPQSVRDSLSNEVHRKFHYIVTRWLQEQGASCVR